MPVSVVPHDAAWRQKFAIEADEIRRALGRNVLAVHHIGSTAVPGILAKPIVDILVDVSRIEGVDEQTERMDELGFEACGEYGIRGRRYLRKPGPGECREFHVHVFQSGSRQLFEHLAFRDYLLAHPDVVQQYSALKAELTANAALSSGEYQDAKSPFVEATLADALEWALKRS